MEYVDVVKTTLSALTSKEYECVVVEECIDQFVKELDGELKRETDNHCFVEDYNSEVIVIACGLRTYYVELDYEIREIVRITKLDIVKMG